MSHTGRTADGDAGSASDVAAALAGAPFVHVVARADGDSLAAAGLVARALADDGTRVIVSGTDQTFRGEPFEPLPELMATAEYVDKLQAICAECGEPATRNQRLIEGEPAHADDPTILVGAEESYQARCRDCHVLRRD